MSPKNNDGSDSGYGKPPKHSQFKKGHSGNPKGRINGTFNMATELERALNEPVVITENGKRKIITKGKAATKQLMNKAAAGDLPAIKFLVNVVRGGEQFVETAIVDPPLRETDKKVMEGILRRFENSLKGGTGNEPDNK